MNQKHYLQIHIKYLVQQNDSRGARDTQPKRCSGGNSKSINCKGGFKHWKVLAESHLLDKHAQLHMATKESNLRPRRQNLKKIMYWLSRMTFLNNLRL